MSLEIEAGGRTIAISKPDKALFPTGETKADLARYHAAVAAWMLPWVADRPLNLQRFPDGIAKKGIFTHRIPSHFPDWIDRVSTPTEDGEATHVIAAEPATLVYLAQQACITLHGWMSRADRLDRPDRLLIDLDPSVEDPGAVRAAARDLAGLLDELGLPPLVMATGSRGYHLVVPLQRRQGYHEVFELARDVARVAAARDPDGLTTEFRKNKRGDRILVDVWRSRYGHTAVVPYSVRARPGAPVATPLRRAELDDPATRADGWDMRSVLARVEADGDPWAGAEPVALGAARRRLDAALAELDGCVSDAGAAAAGGGRRRGGRSPRARPG
jgi:bifunctional non-homologous end joining protein LigD